MRIKTLFYCLFEGIKNLFRNRLMTVASITIIMASLFVVSVFYCVVMNLNYVLDEFEHKIGIAVFFEETTTENDILTLKNQLEVRPEVLSVTYISEEEAWETFRVEYFEGREELLKGFEDENPLEGSSNLQILFEDISKQGELTQLLREHESVRYVKEASDVTKIVQNMNRLVTYISVALIGVLSIVSLFIISNTIRMAMSVKQREITIMRYIGAKSLMIRGPFVVEGVLTGVIGALIPIGIIYNFYDNVIHTLEVQFFLLRDFLVFLPIDELMSHLIPVVIGTGAALGYLGSRLTVRRFLKA